MNENYGRGFDLIDEALALQKDLLGLPERMATARRAEADAYQVLRDTKEALEMIISNETVLHEADIDGKNAEERKRKLEFFIANNPAIVAAHDAVGRADGHYVDAQLETKYVADIMAAVRNALRTLSAVLEYVASENNVTAAEQHATATTKPAF